MTRTPGTEATRASGPGGGARRNGPAAGARP